MSPLNKNVYAIDCSNLFMLLRRYSKQELTMTPLTAPYTEDSKEQSSDL